MFGFQKFSGDAAKKLLILKNGDHLIGLFQDMFEKNILNFNRGWDNNGQKLASFTDVRALQRQLKSKGVTLLTDPDGNPTPSRPACLTQAKPPRANCYNLANGRFHVGSPIRIGCCPTPAPFRPGPRHPLAYRFMLFGTARHRRGNPSLASPLLLG
jgi:hypothetical protein